MTTNDKITTNDKTKSIKVTGALLGLIERILKVNFEIIGEENIPKDKSIMFVANHFTRFETFVIPYIINQVGGLKYCRSLAYKDLFIGGLGEYLTSLKAISTVDPQRDEIIISDLIEKKNNWIIYPEGQMVKDKKISTTKPNIFTSFQSSSISAKTGAAVLAIKAELESRRKGSIFICPITIAYKPIHSKPSKLYLLIKKFIDKRNITPEMEEEVFFESSLLSYSKISIEFHKPICVKTFINENSRLIKFLTFSREKRKEMIIEKLRYPLTNRFMHQVYLKTPLTFDHFFSFIIHSLASSDKTQIKIKHLKELIFNQIATSIVLNRITCAERFKISFSVNHWNLPNLLVDLENFPIFNDTLAVFESKNLGAMKGEVLFLNAEEILMERDFHEVRIKNLFKVLLNEFSYFKRIIKYILPSFKKDEETLRFENGRLLKILMEIDYKEDRAHFKDMNSEENGKPFFLDSLNDKGVLLVHGYRASPGEMRILGQSLNKRYLSVYGVRLKGHGTTAEDMKTRTMEDWIYSCKIGYEILIRKCSKVYICGFSMGGLLALYISEKLNPAAVITISTPIKIVDFKFNFASLAKTFTNIFKKFSSKVKDYVEATPEYPETNYRKNYLTSLSELKDLIGTVEKSLDKVTSPVLVIQNTKDDLVDPVSGMMIYKKIASMEKELYEPDMTKKHVIVRGSGSEKVFERIYNFIKSH